MTDDTPKTKNPLLSWQLLFILLIFLAVIGSFFVYLMVPRSYDYTTDICTYCGLTRTTDSRELFGITYHHTVEYEDTPISQTLTPLMKDPCQHDWYCLRFGEGAQSWGSGMVHADGGTWFLPLKTLYISESFAQNLTQTPDPSNTWHLILTAGDKFPKEMETIMSDWCCGGREDYMPFPQWWAQNEARITFLADPQPSTAPPSP